MRVITNVFRRKGLMLLTVISILLVWVACRPDSAAPTGLGARANPDFAIANSTTNPNNVYLVNKSSIASIPYWTVSWTAGSTNLTQKLSHDSASLYFAFSGTYALQVTLLVAANGGLDSVTKTVNVTIAQNDPTACSSTHLQGFLASCTQKVWTLAPVTGAEEVGPNEGSGAWFFTGPTEPTGDRVCDFNDTYTFMFNSAGNFNFDNKGDFYADSYIGHSNNDCELNSVLSAAQKPWASGNFTYNVASGGSAGLGKLTVNGLGAHIGIAKVQGDGANDNTTAPSATSITYDILSMGHNGSGNYDSLILSTTTSYGAWTYQLRSQD